MRQRLLGLVRAASPKGDCACGCEQRGHQPRAHPAEQRQVYSLPEEQGTVWWLAWSPDGRRLAISRANGDISIWNLEEIDSVLARLALNQ